VSAMSTVHRQQLGSMVLGDGDVCEPTCQCLADVLGLRDMQYVAGICIHGERGSHLPVPG
jgi:hypothetical protein